MTQIKAALSITILAWLGITCTSCSSDDKKPDAVGPSADAVTAACNAWCTKSVQNGCAYTGGADASVQDCATDECNYAATDSSCLAKAKAYFDCVSAAADICNDCSDQFDTLEACHG